MGTNRLLFSAVLPMIMVLSGCDSPAGPSHEPSQAMTSQMVPFKAHYVAQVVGVAECFGGAPRFLAQGTGTGTELGDFTIDLSFCGRGALLDEGEGTFVAANGDLLRITFSGEGDQGFPILHFTSFVTFVGGTGRFEHATGTATVHGSFDVTTGSGPADWVGQISPVGLQ
jgi:hypothetical protein